MTNKEIAEWLKKQVAKIEEDSKDLLNKPVPPYHVAVLQYQLLGNISITLGGIFAILTRETGENK